MLKFLKSPRLSLINKNLFRQKDKSYHRNIVGDDRSNQIMNFFPWELIDPQEITSCAPEKFCKKTGL